MKLPIYQVDAFSGRPFSGNPAAVCPLESWLPDEVMQAIAEENNLSETAFFVPAGASFHLRWFTPAVEVDLCGHATLAAAHVLWQHLGWQGDSVDFETRSGRLEVMRDGKAYVLDFPAWEPQPAEAPEALLQSLGFMPSACYKTRDYLVLLEDEAAVRSLDPDLDEMRSLDCLGVIVSAPGDRADFVSRYFAPRAGVPEDPVTGSAHSTLIPYWGKRLGKTRLLAQQVSARGGLLNCELRGERVRIGGEAVTVLEGTFFLPD